MNFFKLIISLSLFSVSCTLSPIPILGTTFTSLAPDRVQAEKLAKKLRKPSFIGKNHLAKSIAYSPIEGIFGTYAGYLQVSNRLGQLYFPRRHTKPLVFLVISRMIKPIMMFESTVHHLEIDPSAATAFYRCSLEKDDQTELTFWKIEKEELPQNKEVPFESIIIFSDPKYIFVPTGITLATENQNLLLPDLYVIKGIDVMKNSLQLLNLRFLFQPVTSLHQLQQSSYQTILVD